MTQKAQFILLVTQEPELRKLVQEKVSQEFRDVKLLSVENGRQALLKMGLQRFDLVIADLRAPATEASGMIRSLKSDPPEFLPAQVLLVTGSDSKPESLPSDLKEVQQVSMPVEPEKFVTLIRGLLNPSAPSARESADSGKAAEKGPEKAPEKVDVAFINPFIEGTLKVLETMASLKVTREKIFIRSGDMLSGDITAIIAVNSQKYLGSMAISFETNTFLSVVEGMLGEKFEKITPEIQDACAEICNQVFGHAKRILNASGHTIEPAIPSVVVGSGHSVRHMASGPCIAVRFRAPAGTFTVEAVVEERKA